MNKLYCMKRVLFTLALALTFVACNRHSEHWDKLTQVETYVHMRPDSALVVLEQMDPNELSGKEERAKYSLLHSVALYKNYIDKSDFEALQPAIDYYKNHGSATDKLHMYFHQGIIYQNQKNDAQAMISFLKAIEQGGDSEDIATKAQVYYAQGGIYYSLLEWEKYCNVMLKCAELYDALGLRDYYHYTLVGVVNGYTQMGDMALTDKYIDILKQDLSTMNPLVKADFYGVYTTAIASRNDKQAIIELLDEYKSVIPDSRLNYNSIAFAYCKVGEYEEALKAIQRYKVKDTHVSKTRYYSLLSEIYDKLGNDKLALENYKTYITINNNKILQIFKSDTQFMEDKHALEMANAKEIVAKNRLTIIVLACVVALLSLLIIVYVIRKRLKISRSKNILLEREKVFYEQMYNEVVAERDALTKMVEDTSVRDEAKSVIKARLDVLNKVIISQITGTTSANKKAYEELEHLIANRNDFIKSTRLTLEENYPHFVVYLHDKGLEEFEIDFCCLYAIGLKGKDIKAYTNQSRHYKDSSDVRQKLGLLESDTNLSNFLQKLLKKEGE